MLEKPDRAMISTVVEDQVMRKHGYARDTEHLHHDQKPRVQVAFMKDVKH